MKVIQAFLRGAVHLLTFQMLKFHFEKINLWTTFEGGWRVSLSFILGSRHRCSICCSFNLWENFLSNFILWFDGGGFESSIEVFDVIYSRRAHVLNGMVWIFVFESLKNPVLRWSWAVSAAFSSRCTTAQGLFVFANRSIYCGISPRRHTTTPSSRWGTSVVHV